MWKHVSQLLSCVHTGTSSMVWKPVSELPHVYTGKSSTVWKHASQLPSCLHRNIKHTCLSALFMCTWGHQAHSVEACLPAPFMCIQGHQADYGRQMIMSRDIQICEESIILPTWKCFLSAFMWQDVHRNNISLGIYKH